MASAYTQHPQSRTVKDLIKAVAEVYHWRCAIPRRRRPHTLSTRQGSPLAEHFPRTRTIPYVVSGPEQAHFIVYGQVGCLASSYIGMARALTAAP